MVLTSYDWMYGVVQIAVVFLSLIAGGIALTLFKTTRRPVLRAWKYLIPALVLFFLEEVLGALRTFGVYSTPHLTYVIPGVILGFLIAALIVQIEVCKEQHG